MADPASAPAAPRASQALPFWPHAVAVAVALVALGYATGRVRAPATPPEPTVSVTERASREAVPSQPAPLEPQANVIIVEVLPDASRSASAPQLQVEWPAAATMATFVLSLAEARPRERYALVLRSKDGAKVLSAAGLEPTPSATVTIAIPKRFLPPGRYVFELGASGESPPGTASRTYTVEIR